jgi:hypothetical protein
MDRPNGGRKVRGMLNLRLTRADCRCQSSARSRAGWRVDEGRADFSGQPCRALVDLTVRDSEVASSNLVATALNGERLVALNCVAAFPAWWQRTAVCQYRLLTRLRFDAGEVDASRPATRDFSSRPVASTCFLR